MIRTLSVIVMLAASVSGCSGRSAPQTPERANAEALAALRDDREAFEAAAQGDRSDPILKRLRKRGVLSVRQVGRCIEFGWPFTNVLDSIPVIYYAPGGRDDLPSGFWLPSPSQFDYPMEVDAHWFVARKP